MKIKRTMKKQGGAAISERLKLDDASSRPVGNMVGKKGATCALIFGCIALAVAGILTYTLYKHWEYLMPA